jgi:hypothetical protein
MNYATLSAKIQEYVQSTETSFVANIPTFVQLAEERIYNSVQIPAIRRNQIGTLSANNKYLTLPGDWLATFSLAVIAGDGSQEFLLDKDVNFIRQSYPSPTDTGVPAYYAIFDQDTLILGPTPDSNYQVEMHYYYYPESIVTAGTTWIGDNFETVLLYGSLREAYTYLKGEADLIQNYEQKYQEAMQMLLRMGDGLNRRDSYRSGQVRVPVAT